MKHEEDAAMPRAAGLGPENISIFAVGIEHTSDSSNPCRPGDRDVPDANLLTRAREGDEVAFKQLVERYESLVAATAIGMLGRGDDAEEVGQKTFIRFYRALRRFREDSRVGTYLTRIVINLCLDELRRRKRRRFQFWSWEERETLPDELMVHEEQELETKERRELVRRAIQSLDGKHRAVVVMRMLNGYSTKETAAILGIPLGTVLSRLARAQEKLKLILKPLMDESR
jgi:RNA polymerase sigma-70 factor (ECF subfamily)